MLKHLEQVITAAGLPADQVKALVDLPENAENFTADTYVAPIRTNVETAVKNDPKFYETLNKENLPKEFLQKLEAEQYGRSAAIVRSNMLKAVGLKEDDFKELGEEGKKIDVFTPAFVAKLAAGKVTDKELQAKLIEANTKLEELSGQAPAIEEKYKTEYEGKVTDFQFQSNVLGHLASVQGLTAPPKYLQADITRQLKAKYGFAVEDGAVELRQKDKPTLKVLTDNGTKELTLAAAIDAILVADKLVAGKKVEKVETKVEINTEGGGLKIAKGVNDKIANRIAQDAAAGGAK
jgi:hypothetical protein